MTSDPDTCIVPPDDPLFQHYHDEEWGVPVFDDHLFYEKVCLEGFQVGLSWRTILHRRPAFRAAFARFDATIVTTFTARDVERLMQDPGIIRNRRKILSAINNAQRAIELQGEFGSLGAFFRQFIPARADRPDVVTHQWLRDNPQTAESQALASALKKRGWTFVGPVNMYALMQALGIVNDHVAACPRRAAVEILQQRSQQADTVKQS